MSYKIKDYIQKNAQKSVMTRALTHGSVSKDNYERLEFVGDRVLNLIVAHALFELFPDESEGDLAKRHTALVQRATLAEMANKINLSEHVHISIAETDHDGQLENENLLCDLMEAVIAAIFLDIGLSETADMVRELWGETLETMSSPPQDAKTALQEWSQARELGLPVYELVSQEGPSHAPIFNVEVSINNQAPTSGTGTSKRAAEKEAAAKLLEKLKEMGF